MFGKKQPGRRGEIDLSGISALDNSVELARLWAEPQGPLTCVINPLALGPDPFLFGMAMVDTIHHAAKAYSQCVNVSEADALARIWEGLDAERGHPTDTARQIAPDGSSIQ